MDRAGSQEAQSNSRSGRVLVVARPGSPASRLAGALAARGLTPVTLPSLDRAASSVLGCVFDAVILDHALVRHQLEVVYQLRRAAPRVRLLLLTTQEGEADRERVRYAGAELVTMGESTADELAKTLLPPPSEEKKGGWRDTTRRLLAKLKDLVAP